MGKGAQLDWAPHPEHSRTPDRDQVTYSGLDEDYDSRDEKTSDRESGEPKCQAEIE